MAKKSLLVHFIGLTIFHELGHLIGLILCGIQITHFFVPFWLEPITIISPFFRVYDTNNWWIWGWALKNASLDLIPIFVHMILAPLLLELVYLRWKKLPYKLLIPFSLFKGNDLWIMSETIRTFIFLNY